MKNSKTVQALIKIKEKKDRKKYTRLYFLGFIVCFFLGVHFGNQESGLSVMPQTFFLFLSAIFYVYMKSISKFHLVAEFIDWDKVETVKNENNEKPEQEDQHE